MSSITPKQEIKQRQNLETWAQSYFIDSLSKLKRSQYKRVYEDIIKKEEILVKSSMYSNFFYLKVEIIMKILKRKLEKIGNENFSTVSDFLSYTEKAFSDYDKRIIASIEKWMDILESEIKSVKYVINNNNNSSTNSNNKHPPFLQSKYASPIKQASAYNSNSASPSPVLKNKFIITSKKKEVNININDIASSLSVLRMSNEKRNDFLFLVTFSIVKYMNMRIKVNNQLRKYIYNLEIYIHLEHECNFLYSLVMNRHSKGINLNGTYISLSKVSFYLIESYYLLSSFNYSISNFNSGLKFADKGLWLCLQDIYLHNNLVEEGYKPYVKSENELGSKEEAIITYINHFLILKGSIFEKRNEKVESLFCFSQCYFFIDKYMSYNISQYSFRNERSIENSSKSIVSSRNLVNIVNIKSAHFKSNKKLRDLVMTSDKGLINSNDNDFNGRSKNEKNERKVGNSKRVTNFDLVFGLKDRQLNPNAVFKNLIHSIQMKMKSSIHIIDNKKDVLNSKSIHSNQLKSKSQECMSDEKKNEKTSTKRLTKMKKMTTNMKKRVNKAIESLIKSSSNTTEMRFAYGNRNIKERNFEYYTYNNNILNFFLSMKNKDLLKESSIMNLFYNNRNHIVNEAQRRVICKLKRLVLIKKNARLKGEYNIQKIRLRYRMSDNVCLNRRKLHKSDSVFSKNIEKTRNSILFNENNSQNSQHNQKPIKENMNKEHKENDIKVINSMNISIDKAKNKSFHKHQKNITSNTTNSYTNYNNSIMNITNDQNLSKFIKNQAIDLKKRIFNKSKSYKSYTLIDDERNDNPSQNQSFMKGKNMNYIGKSNIINADHKKMSQIPVKVYESYKNTPTNKLKSPSASMSKNQIQSNENNKNTETKRKKIEYYKLISKQKSNDIYSLSKKYRKAFCKLDHIHSAETKFQKGLLNLRRSESEVYNQRKSVDLLELKKNVNVLIKAKRNVVTDSNDDEFNSESLCFNENPYKNIDEKKEVDEGMRRKVGCMLVDKRKHVNVNKSKTYSNFSYLKDSHDVSKISNGVMLSSNTYNKLKLMNKLHEENWNTKVGILNFCIKSYKSVYNK